MMRLDAPIKTLCTRGRGWTRAVTCRTVHLSIHLIGPTGTQAIQKDRVGAVRLRQVRHTSLSAMMRLDAPIKTLCTRGGRRTLKDCRPSTPLLCLASRTTRLSYANACRLQCAICSFLGGKSRSVAE